MKRGRKEFLIGTRGSALALAQAGQVKRLLEKASPNERFRLVTVKTFGDEFQSVESFRQNGVGVFTKAIEEKLGSGQIDLAVHSLKDLPTELPQSLQIAPLPKRLPAEDVLISRGGFDLTHLPQGAIVGTGSPRRKRQLLLARPDLNVVDLRGNLDTRVGKVLKEKTLDAVVVARAGLLRLKKFLKYARPIPVLQMLPAVGQGALAVETRRSDKKANQVTRRIHDASTEKNVTAERDFLKALRGGCRVPVGAHSQIKKNKLILKGAIFSVRSSGVIRDTISVPLSRFRTAGKKLAARLIKKGARRLLAEARSEGALS